MYILGTDNNTNNYSVDVSSPESLAAGFTSFQTDFANALDICVPCAGINRHQTFLDFKFEDHHDLLKINVLGLFHTAQLAARQMIANKTQHGSIVLVASMASYVAVKSQLCSAYCGSKGAVRAMCPAIAKEMAEYVWHRCSLQSKWRLANQVGHPRQLDFTRVCKNGNDSSGELHSPSAIHQHNLIAMAVPSPDRGVESGGDERPHCRAGGYHGGVCVSGQ